MKKCPACGRVYPPEYNVCPVDAAQLRLSAAPAGQPVYGAQRPLAVPQHSGRKGLPVWAWVLIAVGAVFLIIVPICLVLIAVPTAHSVGKRANEMAALNAIKTIATAEEMYAANYPAQGFSCSLAALGGDPAAGAPSADAAQLIQSDITSGNKWGYTFAITNCAKRNVNGADQITGYTVTAIPQRVGSTGDRAFCADQSGVIKYDPEGGRNCTKTLGD